MSARCLLLGLSSQTKCNTLSVRCCNGTSLCPAVTGRPVRDFPPPCRRPFDPQNRGSSGSRAIVNCSRGEAQPRTQSGLQARLRPEAIQDPALERIKARTRSTIAPSRLRGLGPGLVARAGRRPYRPRRRPPGISHETIYRFIYAEIARTKDFSWRLYLPRAKSKRGYRGVRRGSSASFMKQRVSIAQRPEEADDRSQPGHWEADLMMFAKYGQSILTLHERHSRFLFAEKPQNKTADLVAEYLEELL